MSFSRISHTRCLSGSVIAVNKKKLGKGALTWPKLLTLLNDIFT